jgi:hypothetical protein
MRSGRSPGLGIILVPRLPIRTLPDSGWYCSTRPPTQLRGSGGFQPPSLFVPRGDLIVGGMYCVACRESTGAHAENDKPEMRNRK